jgi:DTW domain-containing protein YfiP
MSEPAQVRRNTCERCLRPQSACICRWIASVDSAVEVLILQHPLEVTNAKGSARLLHLSLPNSRLTVGEAFCEADLQALLWMPWGESQAGEGAAVIPRQPVLLYPQSTGVMMEEESAREQLNSATSEIPRQPAHVRLVVLDATWRKSRKMLYLNPVLQALPRLALQDPPPSRYLVRKAHMPHQLSTLEATCQALMQLEPDTPKYRPLLQAFDGFIGQQLSYRPD